MSYTVKFRDKTSTIVDNEDGEKLGLLLMGLKKPDYVEINGDTVRTSEIISVKMTHEAGATIVDPFQQQLEAPKCRAQYSIQLEIMRLAKDCSGKTSDDNPKGKTWGKLLTDKKWKEQMRQKLRQTGALWCDYKANECACDPDFRPTPGRHHAALA